MKRNPRPFQLRGFEVLALETLGPPLAVVAGDCVFVKDQGSQVRNRQLARRDLELHARQAHR
jgi:hypothetical protein